jgi:hypothetical protein
MDMFLCPVFFRLSSKIRFREKIKKELLKML